MYTSQLCLLHDLAKQTQPGSKHSSLRVKRLLCYGTLTAAMAFQKSLNGCSFCCSFIPWVSAILLGLSHWSLDCQTLMVLLEVAQTSASFQTLFTGSAGSFPQGCLVFREKSARCLSGKYPRFEQCGKQNRPRASVVSSGLAGDLLSVGFFSTATAGLLYSATPLLTGKAKQANQGKSDAYGETDAEPEGIKWGVMSVVSFIPLFNWTVSCGACLQAGRVATAAHLCNLSLFCRLGYLLP